MIRERLSKWQFLDEPGNSSYIIANDSVHPIVAYENQPRGIFFTGVNSLLNQSED
jgi:hypothetical protein